MKCLVLTHRLTVKRKTTPPCLLPAGLISWLSGGKRAAVLLWVYSFIRTGLRAEGLKHIDWSPSCEKHRWESDLQLHLGIECDDIDCLSSLCLIPLFWSHLAGIAVVLYFDKLLLFLYWTCDLDHRLINASTSGLPIHSRLQWLFWDAIIDFYS